jgi:hypothetical protein
MATDIFEGATLIGAVVESGLIKTVQELSNGQLCIGSWYVSKTGERKPKGGTLMSKETFKALTASAAKGKAVAFPEVVKEAAPRKLSATAALQAQVEELTKLVALMQEQKVSAKS